MTEINLSTSAVESPEPVTAREDNARSTGSESFIRTVARDVFRRATALAGLAWIGILVIFAAFAPFIRC
jgi:hypothetical protein